MGIIEISESQKKIIGISCVLPVPALFHVNNLVNKETRALVVAL